MRRFFNKKAAIGLAVLCALALLLYVSRQHSSTDWVLIGAGGPNSPEEFKYRYIEIDDGSKVIPVSHPDLTRLTLDLQSGRARGQWVIVPIYSCGSPDVRSGAPSVLCTTIANSDVYLAGNDTVRERLLALKRNGDRASVQGRAAGLFADTPVLWIEDHQPDQTR